MFIIINKNNMHAAVSSYFFFFNDTATTEIYTLSLHDALPISRALHGRGDRGLRLGACVLCAAGGGDDRSRDPARALARGRSEEHTSELQSRLHLVCRLLLEKKKTHDLRCHSRRL